MSNVFILSVDVITSKEDKSNGELNVLVEMRTERLKFEITNYCAYSLTVHCYIK